MSLDIYVPDDTQGGLMYKYLILEDRFVKRMIIAYGLRRRYANRISI